MSSYQPPGAQQPEGTPGYVPPQDPWAGGFEPGHASVPTDPIPQQYPYQNYPQGDVWSQPTMAQGAGYAYPQRPRRTGLIVLIFLLVLVLGGGGGFAAWYVTTQRNVGTGPTNPPSSSVTPSTSASPDQVFDPHTVQEGDCLVNKGTGEQPKMELTACATPGSYKIIRIRTGAGIPENDNGKFDGPVTSVAMCDGTGYETWYGYKDAVDEAKDVFFCMANN